MTATQFTILPPLAFIADVVAEARNARQRVFLQSMEVEPGEITNHLLDILAIGAKRQLDTRLHIDYYSLLVFDGMFNYLPLFSEKKEHRRENRTKKRNEYFTMLKEQGVRITYTNPPTRFEKIFPVMGRNHIKIAVVDDVAWMGGINFHDSNFKGIDAMVKLTDPQLVQALVSLFLDIEERKSIKDRKLSLSETTSLLIDGGEIGKSIILDEAVRLIEAAVESVQVITPIIPDTRLARAIKRAIKRGITVTVTVPHLQKMSGIYKPLDLFNSFVLALQKSPVPITYKRRVIHAKMLLVDNKYVLMGSHNLTTRGVAMGTEELAISSSDQHFASQAGSFFRHVRSL